MASYIRNRTPTRQSDDTMEDDNDEKDDTKRKSRNLSEKKRRDQFNMLVNELGSMVSTNTRKMDKSTVLKSTILFLKNHNEIAVRSRAYEIQEDWKPSFLSNEEFTHLILEALDGFIIAFSSSGRIFYASESITPLLGYLQSELTVANIYDLAYQEDQANLYNLLMDPENSKYQSSIKKENQISFSCHIKRGNLDCREEPVYELIHFTGYYPGTDNDLNINNMVNNNRVSNNTTEDTKKVFVCTGRLQTPQLIREMSVVDNTKTEFTSRHSLEWKFLFLDHRAPPIIGYLPFEVLGTSGYDYYHIDDLDKVVKCHESLMQKGEGTSCHYRFLTKGQQWLWLQTRFYITYNQWNSKPEFIVCTHYVVSYVDVVKKMRRLTDDFKGSRSQNEVVHEKKLAKSIKHNRTPSWSSKSSRTSRSMAPSSQFREGVDSDTTSISACSQSSQSYPSNIPVSQTKIPPIDSSTNLNAIPINGNIENNCQTTEIQQILPPTKLETQAEFIDSSQYATVLMDPAIDGNYAPPTAQVIPPISDELMHQQRLLMVPSKIQSQDQIQKQLQLQRKHEELQQRINLQQEELRKVSEQLWLTKYGMLPPILNVGVPYNGNSCQHAVRPMNAPHQNIQGVNVFPVPISLPLNIVTTPDFFSPALPPNALSTSPIPSHGGFVQMLVPQGQVQGPQAQIAVQPDQTQAAADQTTDLMGFQICQQDDLIYTNMDAVTNQQPS